MSAAKRYCKYRPCCVDSPGSLTTSQGTLAQPPQPHDERTTKRSPTSACRWTSAARSISAHRWRLENLARHPQVRAGGVPNTSGSRTTHTHLSSLEAKSYSPKSRHATVPTGRGPSGSASAAAGRESRSRTRAPPPPPPHSEREAYTSGALSLRRRRASSSRRASSASRAYGRVVDVSWTCRGRVTSPPPRRRRAPRAPPCAPQPAAPCRPSPAAAPSPPRRGAPEVR